jgi:hypothetical protein
MVSGVVLGNDGILGLQDYRVIGDEEGPKWVVAALPSLARQFDGPPDVPGVLAHLLTFIPSFGGSAARAGIALTLSTTDTEFLPAHPPRQDCVSDSPFTGSEVGPTCLDLKKHDLTKVVIAHSVEHEEVDGRTQEARVLRVIRKVSHVRSKVLADLARYNS